MSEVISQTVVFPVPADELFRMYLDPLEHEAITRAPVKIGPNPGDEFSAFEGALSGKILAVVAPNLIVQAWRSMKFKTDDPDSTLILSFKAEGSSGRIDLVHINVPDHDMADVKEGWEKFYWLPWREYVSHKEA